MNYLDLFYQSMRTAIDKKQYRDLVYACFVACMYTLCVNRHFSEFVTHAIAFRRCAYLLLSSSTLAGEEMFFVECMWEKLIWIMAREMLFQERLTDENLMQLVDIARPLSLSDYKDQPHWIQESFVEVTSKTQFIQCLAYIDLHDRNEGGKVKHVLKRRFRRDFVDAIGLKFNQSNLASWGNTRRLRMISRELWSKLLTLLSDVIVWTSAPPDNVWQSTLEIISSILSTLDLICNPEDDDEMVAAVSNLVDVAMCSLVLIGLILSEFPRNETGLLSSRPR
jgi:hypothetical protein